MHHGSHAARVLDLPLPGSQPQLTLRRGWLLKLGVCLPLALAAFGFGLQQFRPATFPQPPVESVVRGSILAADGTVLADGPVDSRSYPYGSMGAGLLGFTGAVQPSGRFGLEGLEYTLDAQLTAGHNVSLTIDPVLQAAADRHLAEATIAAGAESGAVVILEVGTGQILAAASYPTFDANDWRGAGREQMLNRPFQQVYEPGSVIKPLVIAGLLESGRLLPTETIDAPMTLRVGQKTFRDVAKHGPVLSVPDVLAYSSNSAMIHLGQRFAPAELHDWMFRFGIGQDMDLTSTFTRSGMLNPWHLWVPQDQAANSIGQNLSTTPLQLAAAYSVFANDGMYVPPRLSADEAVPEPHRVLSPEVAQGVRSMLVHVTQASGLRDAVVPGVEVAAKTGTADIYDSELGMYVPGDYSLTVAGMFPAAKPKVVVVVMLQKPSDGSTSTYTAGPLFRAVSSEVVAHWGVAPRLSAIAGN
ncbi:MAG TPA: penicillin-binding protein 2 [Trueperaceae bacterium]|nr:penicillin-binding protein 2 [Trueperaceae bacterium]